MADYGETDDLELLGDSEDETSDEDLVHQVLISEDEGEDARAEPATEAEIEHRYDHGQARILTQRNDFLIPNLVQMVQNREILDVAPKYQRRYRWTDKKKSQLIESLLMNVPIPPVFLYERDLARYEVMDGQQRITSITTFFNNEFRLKGLTMWKALNGRYYRDLPSRLQAGLERRGLSAIIILSESSQDADDAMRLRQYVFERLNVGGQPLNNQEVRNCIYASQFNEMLLRIARSDLFTRVWDIPPKESEEPHHISRKLLRNRLYAAMLDCEIVLRYFALRDLRNFGGMKKTLDEYMRRMQKTTKKECALMEAEYAEVLGLAYDLYEQSLFRLPGKNGRLAGRYSIPFSDSLLLGLRPFRAHADMLRSKASQIQTATRDLLTDVEKYEVFVGRGNTKADIEARISLMKVLFQGHV